MNYNRLDRIILALFAVFTTLAFCAGRCIKLWRYW